MTVIPFASTATFIGMTEFSQRTERATKYYDAVAADIYHKHHNDPAFHVLGVLLDQTANPWENVEVTSETLTDLKDDGKVNGSTDPNPFEGV